MPTVRTYEAQQQTKPLPDVRRSGLPVAQRQTSILTAQPNPEAFGGAAGQDIRQIGEQRFSQELQYQDQLHQKAKLQQDRVRVLDADEQLSAWESQALYDPQNGALTKHGQDAFGLPEAVSQGFEKTYGQIWQGLSNDEQRQAFDERAQTRRQDVQNTVLRHVDGQLQQFEAGKQASFLENSRNAAAANASDPIRVGREIQRQRDAIYSFGAAHGVDAETTKKDIAAAESQTHVDVMNALLAGGHDQNARTYYAHNQENILGTSRVGVEKDLREGSVRGESQRTSDLIQNGGGIGMLAPGNLDPFDRPILDNLTGKIVPGFNALSRDKDGNVNYSTTSSASYNAEDLGVGDKYGDEAEVLLPTVVNGKRLTDDEAKEHFRKTGEHLGVFENYKQADVYAQNLHQQQARAIEGGNPRLTLQEMMDQAAQIQDPDVRGHAEEQIKGQYAVWKEQERADRESQTRQAKDALDQTMQQMENLIDTKHPVFARDVVPPDIWNRYLNDESKKALESYARQYQKDGDIETDYPQYYKLMDEASKDPQAFAKRDLYGEFVHKLNPKVEMKQLVEIQSQIRKGNVTEAGKQLSRFQSDDDIVAGTFAELGLTKGKEGSPEYKAYWGLHQMLGEMESRFEQNTGKKPVDTDVQAMVDSLIEPGKKGSWLNLFSSEPVFNVPPRVRSNERTATNPKTGETVVFRNGQWVTP